MAEGNFVSYLRVSTRAQGQSGLGVEAQRKAVEDYLNGGKWNLIAEFVEVESGKRDDRPQLAAALARCRLTGATLIVATIDRLSRKQAFFLSVVEGTGKAGVVFCNLPEIPAGPTGKFIVQQMASIAELEAGLISVRTKAALAAAKARGVKLGGYKGGLKANSALGVAAIKAKADAFAAEAGPTAIALRAQGKTLREIAEQLTADHVRTPRDGRWDVAKVRSLLARAKGAV